MSYPVHRPVAPTTTTSSIVEYICLYTHDLKRKTKRWQDGKLNFHAFNNRIMVYDERGGNVGDAHLSSYQTLDEGEEINLDRGGAIVQVCERLGAVEVDLGELVDKRAREVEKRRKEAATKAPAATRTPQQTPGTERSSGGNVHFQLLQRPLGEIVQTPGRIGRANIPKESPFEKRLQREREEAPPPAKRRRRSPSPPSKSSHATSLFGTSLTLSARPISTWSGRGRGLASKTNTEPLEIEDDEDGVADEARERSRQKEARKLKDQPSKPQTPISREQGAANSAKLTEAQPPAKVVDVDDTAEPHGQDPMPTPRRKAPKIPPAIRKDAAEEKEASKAAVKVNKRHQVAVDRIEHQSVEEQFPKPDPQPRTELRIKSRKRRGLLMLSNYNDHPNPYDNPVCEAQVKTRPSEAGNTETSLQAASISNEEMEVERAENVKAVEEVSADHPVMDVDAVVDCPKGDAASHSSNETREPTPDEEHVGFEQWLSKAQSAEVEEESDGDQGLSFSHNPIDRDVTVSPARNLTEPQARQTTAESPLFVQAPDPEPRFSYHKTGNDVNKDRPAKRRNPYSMVSESKSESESDAPTTRKRPQRPKSKITAEESKAKPSDLPSDASQTEDDWLGPPPDPLRSKQTRPKEVTRGNRTTTKVRVSRVSKSSKSKELIGFKLPDILHSIPDALASAATRIGCTSKQASVPHGFSTAADALAAEDTGKDQPAAYSHCYDAVDAADSVSCDDPPKAAGTLRLANPATRGRKAATKNDAVGRPPQVLVPYEPVVAGRPPRSQRAARPPLTNTNTEAAASPTSRPIADDESLVTGKQHGSFEFTGIVGQASYGYEGEEQDVLVKQQRDPHRSTQAGSQYF
ncbi:uncharacterized protein J7T54_000124 [Emericellopsis cladophorae]|uniref:5'-3' DNA helicase ZGRF1-like N-terminal domain-containing protein n=1 Tax=Emericellopsis cladophorae TaxID=2686198 RepID=A0A9Q0BDF0_9HYPO|nr:uncharacterized protein J7T54_000124 [Emericellopsis cladophorae]KAI6780485.1 hypothetical protein J7T54_000124 [Emericellopsis cladophorae]